MRKFTKEQEKWLWIRGGRTPDEVVWVKKKPYIEMWYYKTPRLYAVPSGKRLQKDLNYISKETFWSW